ncbi:CPBP family intramembrane glutamic endopeptidase [Brachybacterium sp. J144]|uniref:CPBP family intramembrane glutamic endopeptidase n=1 Tax=Brachybacterium sp. J144 TaxID=3116487 RepID=UPI002E76F2CE|nr:CPBP family intramembrane glutamic endopeptidase [Brachybacterium sp. J144]MEE1652176.1 CPBP family intramembrane glutamic endopeptidase [Brachybacterium sp. J144]
MTTRQAGKLRAHVARRRVSIRVLHTLWRPLRISAPGALPRTTAWALVGGLYSVTWLTATVAAIILAFYPHTGAAGTRDSWALLNSIIPALGLTIAGIAVLQMLARITNTAPTTIGVGKRAPWQTSASVFLIALLIFQARGTITLALEAIPGLPDQNSFPWTLPSDPAAELMLILDSMLSGAVEEIIVLAVPIVALRSAGHRWPSILITAVILRTAFHVYYGVIAVPGHLVWALALALLYIVSGRIWPLFAAHMVNNAIASTYYVLDLNDPSAAAAFIGPAQGALLVATTLGLVLTILLSSGLYSARRLNAQRTISGVHQRDTTQD